MLDLKLLAQLTHHIVVKITYIASNNLARNTIKKNYFSLDKLCNHLSRNVCIGIIFHLFHEVVNIQKDKTMTVRSFRLNHSNHVSSPHSERSRRSQNVQWSWRNVDLVTKDLELVTPLDEDVTVHFRCCPIIPSPKDILSHNMLIIMYTFTTFLYGPYDHAWFVSTHLSNIES